MPTDVATKKIGTVDVHVALLVLKTLNGNQDATANSTDGKAEITSETETRENPRLSAYPETRRVGFLCAKRVRRDGLGSMEVGSVTIMRRMDLKQRRTGHPSGIVNGGVTDMAQTVTGPGAPNSSKSLSGWTRQIARNQGLCILKKILNVGRRE